MTPTSAIPLVFVTTVVCCGAAGVIVARRWRRRTHYRPHVLGVLIVLGGAVTAASIAVLPVTTWMLASVGYAGFSAGAVVYVRTRWVREAGVGELGARFAERSGFTDWVKDRFAADWRSSLAERTAWSLVSTDGTVALLGAEVARSDGRPTGDVVGVRLGQMRPGPGNNSGVVGLLIGRPDSGKTTTAIRLLHATAEADPLGSIIVVDPKGDAALRRAAEAIAAKQGTTFWEWTRDSPLDPLTSGVADADLQVQACVARVMAAQTFSEDYYKAVALDAYTDAAELLVGAGRTLTLAGMARALTPSGAQELIAAITARTRAGETSAAVHAQAVEWVKGHDARSWANLAGAASRLSSLARSGIGVLFATPERPGRSISDLATTPGISYLHLDAGMWPDAALEVAELLAVGLMQDLGRIAETSEHTITMFVDELGAIPARRMDAMLQRGRAAGFSIYVAAQTLAAIGATTPELFSQLTGTLSWLIGHAALGQSESGEDDAERIARLGGTRIELELTTQTSGGVMALPTGTGTVRQVDAYIAHPNLLRSLPQGRAVVIDVAESTTSPRRARLCGVAPFPPTRRERRPDLEPLVAPTTDATDATRRAC